MILLQFPLLTSSARLNDLSKAPPLQPHDGGSIFTLFISVGHEDMAFHPGLHRQTLNEPTPANLHSISSEPNFLLVIVSSIGPKMWPSSCSLMCSFCCAGVS